MSDSIPQRQKEFIVYSAECLLIKIIIKKVRIVANINESYIDDARSGGCCGSGDSSSSGGGGSSGIRR